VRHRRGGQAIGIWDTPRARICSGCARRKGSRHIRGPSRSCGSARRQLVSAGRDHTVKVWKLSENAATLVRVHAGRTCEVSHLGVSPEGRRVLLGSRRRVAHRRPGRRRRSGLASQPTSGPLSGLAEFSPSGRLVLTASSNMRLQLWSGAAGRGGDPVLPSGYAQGFHRGSLLACGGDPLGFGRPDTRLGTGAALWNLSGGEIRHLRHPGASAVQAGVFRPRRIRCSLPRAATRSCASGRPPCLRNGKSLTKRLSPMWAIRSSGGTDMVRIRAELAKPNGTRTPSACRHVCDAAYLSRDGGS